MGLLSSYCDELGTNALLANQEDPVPILQVFARWLRTEALAPSAHSIKKRTVEAYLRSVGQTFKALGSQDPRTTLTGATNFCLL